MLKWNRKKMCTQIQGRTRQMLATFGIMSLALSANAVGVEHFQTAPGPNNFWVTPSSTVLPHLKPSAWLMGSYGHDSLVCRSRDGLGQIQHKIIEHQATANLGLSLGLFDWVELGLDMPFTYAKGPAFPNSLLRCGSFPAEVEAQGVDDFIWDDVRAMLKLRISPNLEEGFLGHIRVWAEFPSAQLMGEVGETFGGDAMPNIAPAINLGYGSKWFRIAGDVGYLIRQPNNLGDLRIGHELTYALATEFAFKPRVAYATIDAYGKWAIENDTQDFFSSQTQVPAEVDLGLKFFAGPVGFFIGGGTGLFPDYGTPDFRVFAGLGYYRHPEEEVLEEEPEEEIVDDEPSDRDGDGIFDVDDECPDAPEDRDGFEDDDGCPDVDNDGDGILDIDDGCPDEAEDRDRWEDADGCPDVDNDNDKILDVDDACPNDPENYNDNEDEDGCPDGDKVLVRLKRGQIEILERVHFAYDSDRILPRSYPLLDNVARVIKEHSEIDAVRVEGHTDADGSEQYNLNLSDRRSRSVRTYLIEAGVERDRLEAKGFGESQPIADNRSEEGKARNRRVEFRILGNSTGVQDTTSVDAQPETETESKKLDYEELPEGSDENN